MDRIMSASIILLDQNFNANDVDIMVFQPCILFSPWGGLNPLSNIWYGSFNAETV